MTAKAFFDYYQLSVSGDALGLSGNKFHQMLEALLHEIGHAILLWPNDYKEQLRVAGLENEYAKKINKQIYVALRETKRQSPITYFDDPEYIMCEAGLTYDQSDKQEIATSIACILVSRQLKLKLDEPEIIDNASMNLHRSGYSLELKRPKQIKNAKKKAEEIERIIARHCSPQTIELKDKLAELVAERHNG